MGILYYISPTSLATIQNYKTYTALYMNNNRYLKHHRLFGHRSRARLTTSPALYPAYLHTCATLKICNPHFSLARNTIGLLLHRPVTNKCSYYIYMYRYLYAQSYKFHCIEHSWFGGYGFGLPKFYSHC